MMNKNLLITIAIVFASNQFQTTKADLSIVSYDVECPIADPEYFKDIEVYIENEGRDNEFFINFTLIKILPADAMITLKMIGASMGEFVVSTGIDFTVKACSAVDEPIFGQHIYRQLGINEEECPSPPGVYGGSHVNLVSLDTLPDTFPPNDYKITLTSQQEDHIFYQCWTYFKIQ
ncbi:uncharacterized protein [Chelonus insularis]|uniref:uncharacterized protein n=1 Tax=Chelonus insularis TaxID=460826 RepID=UPI00158A5246|nr:uncharacterized protein LOC118069572 [Chelonus insularis]